MGSLMDIYLISINSGPYDDILIVVQQCESVFQQWIDCLRHEPIANLLQIPSGDHWPCSLKEFVQTLRYLVFPREPTDLQRVLQDLDVIAVNNVLSQVRNGDIGDLLEHVEVLAAVITSIARSAGANTIIDVGSGQYEPKAMDYGKLDEEFLATGV
ncbi:hypothetical protein MKW98_025214 [Papaver atlanticum]|uniref:Uncharacterized protein n=1 Tax=Papaver atlanticum TaxID=357466 RepID=A0AAD4S2S0_9MAGN|nr:hypothetical protein MKW98_025214 [Papaver atlanticum]